VPPTPHRQFTVGNNLEGQLADLPGNQRIHRRRTGRVRRSFSAMAIRTALSMPNRVLGEMGEQGPAPLMDMNIMVVLGGRDIPRAERKSRFATDSPLEGPGFEPSVPV